MSSTTNGLSCTVLGASEEIINQPCTYCRKISKKTVESDFYCIDCELFFCETCMEFHSFIPALENHIVLGKDQIQSLGKRYNLQQNHSPISIEKQPICSEVEVKTASNIKVTKEESSIFNVIVMKEESSSSYVIVTKEDSPSSNVIVTKEGSSSSNVIVTKEEFPSSNVIVTKEESPSSNVKVTKEESPSSNVIVKKEESSSSNVIVTKEESPSFNVKVTKEESPSSNVIDTKEGFSSSNVIVTKEESPSSNVKVTKEESPSSNGIVTIKESPGPDVKVKKEINSSELRAGNVRKYKIRVEEDKKNCYIRGSCQLLDGTILLADTNNKKLKHLNGKYCVIDHYSVSDAPTAICNISWNEVAMTTNKIIYFISVTSDHMEEISSITTRHFCYGIAYNSENDNIYVSDGKDKVFTYDKLGHCLQTLWTDKANILMFYQTRHIAISEDQSKIYVCDASNGVVTLDHTGALLATYTNPELSEAKGVCVDQNGQVLVCGYKSGSVIQMDESGQRKTGVVVASGDIPHPLSICVHELNQTLVVSTGDLNGCDFITVFDLIKG